MDEFDSFCRESIVKKANLLLKNGFSNEITFSPLFCTKKINSNLMFTTASSLQLCEKNCLSPVKTPSHIICLSDDHDTLMDLFVSLYLSPRLLSIKSVTLILPLCFESDISRFITEVISTVSAPVYLSKVFSTTLNGLNRQVITFKNADFAKVVYTLKLVDCKAPVERAYNFALSCFSSTIGLMVDRNFVDDLTEHLSIRLHETFWYIGCQEPFLLVALSAAASGGTIIATSTVSNFHNMTDCLSRSLETTAEGLQVQTDLPILCECV